MPQRDTELLPHAEDAREEALGGGLIRPAVLRPRALAAARCKAKRERWKGRIRGCACPFVFGRRKDALAHAKEGRPARSPFERSSLGTGVFWYPVTFGSWLAVDDERSLPYCWQRQRKKRCLLGPVRAFESLASHRQLLLCLCQPGPGLCQLGIQPVTLLLPLLALVLQKQHPARAYRLFLKVQGEMGFRLCFPSWPVSQGRASAPELCTGR